jgi:hypothetical protein
MWRVEPSASPPPSAVAVCSPSASPSAASSSQCERAVPTTRSVMWRVEPTSPSLSAAVVGSSVHVSRERLLERPDRVRGARWGQGRRGVVLFDGHKVVLTARSVRDEIKDIAPRNGLPPNRFNAHSLRKGSITHMRAQGATEDGRRDRGSYAAGSSRLMRSVA